MNAEAADLNDVLDVANRVATVDGAINSAEKAIIAEVQRRTTRI